MIHATATGSPISPGKVVSATETQYKDQVTAVCDAVLFRWTPWQTAPHNYRTYKRHSQNKNQI